MPSYFRYILFTVFSIAFAFAGWSLSRTPIGSLEYANINKNEPDVNIKSFGENRKQGNILGIQVLIQTADFANRDNYFIKIENYLETARKKGFLNNKTIAIFPEHIGTFLFIEGEKREAILSENTSAALNTIYFSHIPGMIINLSKTPSPVNKFKLVLQMKFSAMKSIYENTFARLAKTYGIYIVAGSIILPENGNFFNIAHVFSPEGKIIKKIYKTKPTPMESQIITPGEKGEPFSIEGISEKISVLFSHDGLYDSTYENLKKADIIISIGFISENEIIDWNDKSITGNVQDKSLEITNKTYDRALWEKYSILEKIKSTEARIGMEIFLKGKIFQFKLTGASGYHRRYVKVETLENIQEPALINLWL